MKLDDIYEQIRKENEDALKRVEHNKHILFDLFDANGIDGAEARFDGSGDSGNVEDVSIHSDDPKANALLDEETVGAKLLHSTGYGPEGVVYNLDPGPITVKDLIEGICYECLHGSHRGWENNDGAYGDFAFDTATRSITLQYYERATELHEHSF
jgi:hypothetical protein